MLSACTVVLKVLISYVCTFWKKMNFLKINKLSLTIFVVVLIVSVMNSLMLRAGIYSYFNWVIDYSYGFCKRGFLGTAFHLILEIFDCEWNFKNLNFAVFVSHIVLTLSSSVTLFLIFIYMLSKYQKLKAFLTFLFVTLLSSIFIRNLFYLTGYLDIWIVQLLLIAFVFFIAKKYNAMIITIVVANLFSELACVLYLPIAFSIFVSKGIKFSLGLSLIPFVTAFLVHLSGIPVEHASEFFARFGDFTQFQKKHFDDFLFSIYSLFRNQYDLFDYITTRLTFIYNNFVSMMLGFCVLGFVIVSYFCFVGKIIFRLDVSTYFKFFYLFCTFFCIFSPLCLLLVATDFYRFIGFSVFAGFICILSLIIEFDGRIELFESMFSLKSKVLVPLTVVFSCFTFILPPLTTSGPNYVLFTEETLANVERSNSFVFKPLFYSGDLLYSFFAHLSYDHENSFTQQTIIEPRDTMLCSRNGDYRVGDSQSYGKTRLLLKSSFDDDDPDQYKYVWLYDKKFRVEKNFMNEYEFYISPSLSMKYPATVLLAEPSSSDWSIEFLQLQKID